LVFRVNESYVSQELHHIVPIIYWVYCYKIQWPSATTRALLEGTMGKVDAGAIASMDFTISPRQHSRAVDEDYYCGDKGVPFFNNFAVFDFWGVWLDFTSGYQGHAADQRSFLLTDVGLGDKRLRKRQKILADAGFAASEHVITPSNQEKSRSRLIKVNRCSVENNFRDLKILRAVAETS